MKKVAVILSALCMLAAPLAGFATNPDQDLKDFRKYFTDKFPDVPLQDFTNGVYAVDKPSREQWEAFEEFPPYEIFIDKGEDLYKKPFKNGKTYASCFPGVAKGIKQDYPYFDTKRTEVITLELAINECREKNGEKKLGWKKGKIAHLSAYISYQARGQKGAVTIVNSADSMAWYERGKKHFYAKRGQLNMSCADCHYYNAGNKIRADILSPALGHTSHFPVYRNKWSLKSTSGDGMGTMHRRYGGCNKQVRAKPFKAQSTEYRALEYFHTYMSNGLVLNGPGVRK
ncbi:Sulfur oxidation protein SoxA [hydrothermal vent metagenome]|uniref:L-cysteine S-thiosulfotransferase subunit SoxA n=1 Tax=hydrothermal vent metagenome TaxID=652676 RepID=A0A3B0YU92_9ZZZZ